MGRKDTRELHGEYENNYEPEDAVDGYFSEEEAGEEEVKKPRKRKKRKKKRYLLKFFLFCLVVTGMVALLLSNYFNVDKIQVEGNKNYSDKEIIAMSEVKTGKNLFKVKKSDITHRMLKDSYLKSVKVSRKLPDTLVIHVEEREETAVIPYGDQFIIIDSKGYVLNKVDKGPELTQLLGLNIKTMDKGKKIQVKEEDVLEDTLSMLETMKDNDLFFKKIDMTNVVIKAYIYDELMCKGTPENILTNMENGNLETILYDLYKKNITKGVIHIGDDQYCSFSPNIE